MNHRNTIPSKRRRKVNGKNNSMGSYTSPALAAASYPFVDLLPENTLRYKLFPFSKFYNRPLYFSETMKYNEVNDKLEFIKES